MHRSQFWPQNSLQMANTIKNWISLNLRECEKNEKITSNDLTSFFAFFYSCLVTKTAVRASKNSSKRWWNFFRNFSILTENLVYFDVTLLLCHIRQCNMERLQITLNSMLKRNAYSSSLDIPQTLMPIITLKPSRNKKGRKFF